MRTPLYVNPFEFQSLEDNVEAEQMIRAIRHGEIDNSVYSQMADDLEKAAQMKRQVRGCVMRKNSVALARGLPG